MSGPTQDNERVDSVDLTEDEQSSEEYFANESTPLNFVDCNTTGDTIVSTFANPSLSPSTRANKIVPLGFTKQTVKFKNLPKLIKKHEPIMGPAILSHRKVGKIKPQPRILAETQDVDVDPPKTMETICVDPDEGKPRGKLSDVPSSQNVPVGYQVTPNDSQNYTIYSQKQPGKVVIIKKNNKYYKIVIPHNVMPNINQSSGPVLINIPEVGPLLIKNDPQVTNANSIPVDQPFSLNLDDVQGQPKMSTQVNKKPRRMPEMSPKEAALCNKKFCWTFCRGKKRDLEGFCYTDRLGFTQAEYRRTKKCSTILNSMVEKKRTEIINLMHKFNEFKESTIKKKQVKLGKTNATGKTSKNRINKGKFDVDDSVLPPPLPKIPKEMTMALEHMSYDSTNKDTDYGCDLLLTKKVVILNSRDTQPITKKKKYNKRKKLTTQKRKTSNKMKLKRLWARKLIQHKQTIANNSKSFMLKPCYVQMVRDETVEEAYRKYIKAFGFNFKQKTKVESDYPTKAVSKRKPKQNSNSNLVNIRPSLAPKPTGLQKSTNIKINGKDSFLSNTISILTARIITSVEEFKKEINYLKPLLIINKHNLGIVNYTSQFAKSNIIYVVKENRDFPLSILKNESFISAFELGYLKLIDSQLFCKYIMGDETFNQPGAGYVSDHNYCMSKK